MIPKNTLQNMQIVDLLWLSALIREIEFLIIIKLQLLI